MIDTLLEHKGAVNIFGDSWTWRNCRVQDADETGVIVTFVDRSPQAIPWVRIKNIELVK